VVSTPGHAETRLMPDPNGAFLSTATIDGPNCCSTGSLNAGADPAVASMTTPENADNPASMGAVDPGAPKPEDLVPDAAAPGVSGWRSLLSSLLQGAGAAR